MPLGLHGVEKKGRASIGKRGSKEGSHKATSPVVAAGTNRESNGDDDVDLDDYGLMMQLASKQMQAARQSLSDLYAYLSDSDGEREQRRERKRKSGSKRESFKRQVSSLVDTDALSGNFSSAVTMMKTASGLQAPQTPEERLAAIKAKAAAKKEEARIKKLEEEKEEERRRKRKANKGKCRRIVGACRSICA